MALPGGVRRYRRRALRARVLHRRRQARAEARHRPAGRHPGHARGPHGRRRGAAATSSCRRSRSSSSASRPGCGGAEVVLDGDNITITVPGDAGEQARSLGQTAQLRFRPVIGQPVPAAPAMAPPAGVTPDAGCHARACRPVARRYPRPVPDAAGRRRPGPAAGEAGRLPRAVAGARAPPRPRSPPPPPAPGGRCADGRRPPLAKEIAAARAVQQSTDPSTRRIALQTLDCSKPDPLTGYDDPALPLVTCNQDGTVKYALGPSFLEGTQIASAQAAANGQGVGYVVNVTFKSAGEAIWGKYTAAHIGTRSRSPWTARSSRRPRSGRDHRPHRDLRLVQPGRGAEPRRS